MGNGLSWFVAYMTRRSLILKGQRLAIRRGQLENTCGVLVDLAGTVRPKSSLSLLLQQLCTPVDSGILPCQLIMRLRFCLGVYSRCLEGCAKSFQRGKCIDGLGWSQDVFPPSSHSCHDIQACEMYGPITAPQPGGLAHSAAYCPF